MIQYKYRPEIDGLRALAVVLVLLFHAGLGFPGGYVGVDVFFVISGFLITQIILKEQASEAFRFRTFWLRRVRRILPASLTMVVVVLMAGAFLLLPKDYERLAEATVAQQLLFANIHFWKNTGYFDGSSEMMPLLHTWSLAVEEQFYLFYPCVLVAIGQLRKQLKVTALVAIFAVSFVWSAIAVHQDPSAAFYLLPTRAWEMLLGGILCFAKPSSLSLKVRELLSWSGLLAIFISSWCFDSLTPFPGLAALLPCVGTATLIYSNTVERTGAGRCLAVSPAVFVGKLSYSLYLWHWPIFAFARYWIGEELGVVNALVLLAVTFVIAVISWKFIETPFRQQRARESKVETRGVRGFRPFLPAVIATLFLVGSAVLIQEGNGFRQRFSDDVLAILDSSKVPTEYYTRPTETPTVYPALGVRHGRGDIDFFVWGDSHAMAIGELVHQLAESRELHGEIAAAPGTLPLLGVWRAGATEQKTTTLKWNQSVVNYIREKRISHVILVGRWAVHVEGRPNGQLDTLIVDDESSRTSFGEARKVLARGFRRTLDALEEAGATVWVLGQVPLQEEQPVKRLVRSKLFGASDVVPKGVAYADHLKRQSNVLHVLSELKGQYVFVDPADECFDANGFSQLSDSATSFYYDNDHVSPDGAVALLTPLLEPVFADISATHTGARSKTSSTARR